jgi:hypothetical protein
VIKIDRSFWCAARELCARVTIEEGNYKMADDQNTKQDQAEDEHVSSSTSSFPLGPSTDVVVTHLDAPPRVASRSIHRRRPAPIVPERQPDSGPDDENKK